ncbi:uncharacterized protein N7479_004069 [Penicillium vulpinum]|uniref:HECT-type E3 ubiquitin transferase n=1 Tax=Penicillium vulpinum TaxID=29845 RepID=A0A1V6SCV9_9EURO|nr:uncharacterized protein N7479_004069 [Penicillium vulpinum]KAJ5964193.1 hypothetical protein N7479_004069 [Penicillium vulpinum]OQE11847.1 hypothetical protein PENVUL_c002G06632 [Penicillium vulpinum]
MPSRFERHPPIPPVSSSGTAAIPLHPSQIHGRETSPRRPARPHDVSIVSPANGSMPRSSQNRGHSRSISNPFAGFGRKRDKTAAKYATWDSDDDDDDEVTYPLEPESSSPRKGAAGNDIAEGKCQTCDATVRWPRHLKVFRCTDCLMITDLEPISHESKDNTPQGPQGGASRLASKVFPLTVNQTRGMIGGCLNVYFDSLLEIGSRSGLLPDDDRKNKPLPDLPPMQTHASGSNHLSPPRTGGPRNRSASHSSEQERLAASKENSVYLTPQSVRWEGNDTPVRVRANSDLRSTPKLDGRPQGVSQAGSPGPQICDNRTPIFKQLEITITTAFKGCDCLNESFTTHPPPQSARSASNGNPPRMKMEPTTMPQSAHATPVFEPDAKTLLLGDLTENSAWWMNEWAEAEGQNPAYNKEKSNQKSRMVSSRSPRINWIEVSQWYHLILSAGSSWTDVWAAKKPDPTRSEADSIRAKRWASIDPSLIGRQIGESRLHLQRALLKATESLLKRPRRVLKKPEDTRFLFILLANPMLSSPASYCQHTPTMPSHRDDRRPSHPKDHPKLVIRNGKLSHKDLPKASARLEGSSHHYGILKRILGLMSNLPNDCHHYLVSWASRFSVRHLERLVELIGGFITYRLSRQHGRKRPQNPQDGDDLIPSFASASGNTAAELHAAINRSSTNKKSGKTSEDPMVYTEDWQIRAAARVMSLFFTANVSTATRKYDGTPRSLEMPKNPGPRQGHMIPISTFYNTLLDYSDLVTDFETWEAKATKFSFCQYPFLLSIWAKIHIMEHDARRQMEVKARDAFFNSVLNHMAVSQYLVLKVRRECLIEDSLKGVSEVVGTGQEEIKKGLRIEFSGEEGIDAGGLRKEWFLLLVREVFDPLHGLFIYDDDSQYCYFNPYCFESSEQFFLVGVLLGLAIYNSTILDVDLPPFAFKKLLSSAPHASGPQTATSLRSTFKCTLEDLAEYRPALAKGLRGLLEFEGNVAETFCYDFVAQVDRYGEIISVPLCANGENRPVTNSNKREFVDLYVKYLLDTAVARQFEPFKRGFFTVCGGNALSLFRPEEIEMLVRGSDEPLDVSSLQAVATYDNWSHPQPESVPVVRWFWEFFEKSQPQAQRKILSFITGSDRIPAMGAASLIIRLACLGDDCRRYPIARTCFNTLGLHRYSTREKLQQLLWDAVVNSEGFGLK